MESSNTSSKNLTTAINETIATQTPDSCFSFPDVYIETLDSTAPYIVIAALNVILSVVTTIANILVFAAIRKSTSLHLPSKLLLCGLVLTDLGVGLIVQPLFAAFLVYKVKDVSGSGVLCFLTASSTIIGTTMGCASLLTMTLISVDRYIAFHFHLRYKEILTAKRVVVVLVAVWLFSVFMASTFLWNGMLYDYLILASGSFSFLVTSLAYIKIFFGLRHQHGHQVQDQAQVETQQLSGNALNVAKYRRSASNMLWIYCVFILCFVPYVLTSIALLTVGYTVLILCIGDFTATVIYLNSCLNPFLYCYRLPEIRMGVLQTLRRICGQSPQQ